MDEVARFLQGHRATLLRYLDGKAPERPGEPDALAYVQGVLDEWMEQFCGRRLPEASRRERAFWFALYQLEELELAGVREAESVDPFEGMMMENLACVREVLRSGSDLPSQFYATRPGELEALDEPAVIGRE